MGFIFNMLRSKIISKSPQKYSESVSKTSTLQPDYIVIDLETTNLSVKTAEIIEISAIMVKDSVVINQFSSLVKPKGEISPAASAVNNITSEMLKNERSIKQVLPEFLSFIGNSVLMGYNIATFDFPILQREAKKLGFQLSNDYFDVLGMAREKLFFLPNNKLTTVASYFMIDTTGSHRALQDCFITKRCYELLLTFVPPQTTKKQKKKYHTTYTEQTTSFQELDALLQGVVADNVLSEDEVNYLSKWLNDHETLSGQFPYDRIFNVVSSALSDGVLEQSELDEMLTLFKIYLSPVGSDTITDTNLQDKAVVLSGEFAKGSKDDIEKILINHGCIVRKSVSSKTDFLIVGSLGSADWSNGNYGNKIKKAKEIQANGGKIKIITEDTFFGLLNQKDRRGRRQYRR